MSEHQIGDTWRSPSTGIELVYIPPGEFDMGSGSVEAAQLEQPVHRVRIQRGYWLGKYPVTRAQWESVMGTHKGIVKWPDRPVGRASWNDAQRFLKKISAKGEGRYRLPTEAEWEYAARSGTRGDRCGEMAQVGRYDPNSGRLIQPMGLEQPNGWGLCGMLGNVWEWCADWYGAYSEGMQVDPTGPASGDRRVMRGCPWPEIATLFRFSIRFEGLPGTEGNRLGFRCVRELE